MVAKISVGKSIKGALKYNEHKVASGNAILLAAVGYLRPEADLSFKEKLGRLQHLAGLHEGAQVNCVHVSLNFGKGDTLDKARMLEVAGQYLDKIGFGIQPYLAYQHWDASHLHMHIVTTNIRADGGRIPLHNIGRDKSMKACRELEKEYNLVIAEGKNQALTELPKPVPGKVTYGKSETKSAVSNTVRAVVRDYMFTSLPELNAVLRGFNIEGDRGGAGTKMYENKGLSYHVLDKNGNHIGVPVKSSSIYTKPTLKNLEPVFLANKTKRQGHKIQLRQTIDRVLRTDISDRSSFKYLLGKAGVEAVFRENDSMAYGITFIDHNSRCVFNGSDLGKGYTASKILQRIKNSGRTESQKQENELAVLKSYIQNMDYTIAPQKTVGQIYADGYNMEMRKNSLGNNKYYLTHGDGRSGIIAGGTSRLDRYFEKAGITESLCKHLNEHATHIGGGQAQQYVQSLFSASPTTYFGHMGTDKKKPRRKVNW